MSVVPVSQPISASEAPVIVGPDFSIADDSGEEVPSRRPRRTVKINEPQKTLDKRRPVKDRWFYEPVLGSETSMLACAPSGTVHDEMIENLLKATDKWEAALAAQPEAAWPSSTTSCGEKKKKEKSVVLNN